MCNITLDARLAFEDVVSCDGDDSPISQSRDVFQTLMKEKLRRKKLSRLYEEQTTVNELLRDENDSLHNQQRALVRLLQEKDKLLDNSTPGNSLAR